MDVSIEFYKMHGTGNDFVVIDCIQQPLNEATLPNLARKICDRHFGVGADQLLLVHPSEEADFRFQIFNSDGSEAEMCGNGIRCFAKFVFDHGNTCKEKFAIETLAGIQNVQLKLEDGHIATVEADMGKPHLRPDEIPVQADSEIVKDYPIVVDGEQMRFTAVSIGNPHCVIFVDDLNQVPVESWGRKIEHHPLFPHRTNVEFVEVVDTDEVRVRVWERGTGMTLACGTGACASLVAASLTERTLRKAVIQLPGGGLLVEWRDDGHVYLTGPAVEVFSGILGNEWEEI